MPDNEDELTGLPVAGALATPFVLAGMEGLTGITIASGISVVTGAAMLAAVPVAAVAVVALDMQYEARMRDYWAKMSVEHALPVDPNFHQNWMKTQAGAKRRLLEAWAAEHGTTYEALVAKYRKDRAKVRKFLKFKKFHWPGLHHATTDQMRTIYLKNNDINDRWRKIRR